MTHPTGSREFTVANAYQYNYRSPVRWLASHIWRYPFLLILAKHVSGDGRARL